MLGDMQLQLPVLFQPVHQIQRQCGLAVAHRFVAGYPRLTDIAKHGADVLMLEFDGAAVALWQLGLQGAVMGGFVIRLAAHFERQHRHIVGDDEFDFCLRPVVSGCHDVALLER